MPPRPDLSSAVARHRADGPEPDLRAAVDAVLRGLAPGEVVAYGEVAAEAGWPGRARAVGTILARSGEGRDPPDRYPWWRVVNANGRLVPGLEKEQAARLNAEGVTVSGHRVRPSRSRT